MKVMQITCTLFYTLCLMFVPLSLYYGQNAVSLTYKKGYGNTGSGM